ncbi:MAG: alpha/beta hydrolase [Oscillospiraceae bacterium]|nr:alpha/beta hydrolase [Oscillospiraceae bacterium]
MLAGYGQRIPVGKGKLNIYTEGNGKATIVVLAGAGVTSPVLEYKPLYHKLSDTYKIAVIEKPGYGLAESTGTERTVQNLVREDRAALKGAGIEPPYILMPHSYSGFETIYWANTYPDEVLAVLSIDMGLPDTALEMIPEQTEKSEKSSRRIYAKIRKRGLLDKLLRKWTVDASGMLSSDHLNAEEKQLYEKLFYQNLGSEEVFDENKHLISNGIESGKTGKLKVPAFFYISDMKVPVKQGSWRDFAVKYAESIGAEYQLTDKGHLMYSVIPDQMVSDFRRFLDGVISSQ